MASRYVRTMVRDWMNQGNVTFYDTVNFEVDPQDAIWSSAEWMYSNRTIDTFCGTALEEGTFTIAFFGRPGIGDDTLLEAAEEEIALLMSRVDSSGKLILLDFDPPKDFREGEHYVAEVMVGYEFRS